MLQTVYPIVTAIEVDYHKRKQKCCDENNEDIFTTKRIYSVPVHTKGSLRNINRNSLKTALL